MRGSVRAGQLAAHQGLWAAHKGMAATSGPAAPCAAKAPQAVAKGGVREAEGSLNRLYEVVRSQQRCDRPFSPSEVQQICSVIENISLEDLGVDPAFAQALAYGSAGQARQLRFQLRPRGSRGTVTYLDIHDDPTMTIGIFQLPPGARMPLHDHPGMTVFSRLLYGTLHVRAYDWVAAPNGAGCDSGPSSPSSSGGSSGSTCTCTSGALGGVGGSIQPARLVTDTVLTAPADTMVLFPHSGGNIHAFTAISPCAILDVLTPPYGDRNCTYYREVFPPQWLDSQGRPAFVPSEDVASWVAWQQGGQQQQDPNAQQQQQQQQYNPNARITQYHNPGGPGGGQEDIVVGLEVWREPSDFHVARGLYRGQRVTAGGGGAARGGS